MKLWDKGVELHPDVERFTVGDDPILDEALVVFDCRASAAHARMLAGIGLLTPDEALRLVAELEAIARESAAGTRILGPGDEDCHTALENRLVARCGDAGKRLHLGRSRNDQVLTALRLYELDRLGHIEQAVLALDRDLGAARAAFGLVPMPGYTHTRRAMPTTVGVWLGAFEAALADDLRLLRATRELLDQNPLGTAAGFGVPVFALDREQTTRELGFARTLENPLYAQHSRGKLEAVLLGLLSTIALDLNRLSTDLILFSAPEFGFVELPQALCTGSSIMPQKQNPDPLELVRASYHVIRGAEQTVMGIVGNQISGYHRDLQLTKGPVMAALARTADCLRITGLVVQKMRIDPEACARALDPAIYATERALRLVEQGVPFRDAYRQVAAALQEQDESGADQAEEGRR